MDKNSFITYFQHLLDEDGNVEDTLKRISPKTKEMWRNITIFADLFDSEREKGKLKRFRISRLMDFPELTTENDIWDHQLPVSHNFTKILKQYNLEIQKSREWLLYMCLLERVLLQIKNYTSPRLTYRILQQKSGENTFRYIVVRAPFYDLYKGAIEVRAYHGKLEDHPGCNSISDIIKRKNDFEEGAIKIIKRSMWDEMKRTNTEGIVQILLDKHLDSSNLRGVDKRKKRG